MEFFKTYNTGKNGFTTIKFSSEEYLNYNIVMLLIYFFLGVVFSVIVSPILVILRLVSCEDNDSRVFSLIGALVSIYLLVDIHYGWILSSLIGAFNPMNIPFLFTTSLALLICHLFLLVYPVKRPWQAFFVTALIFVVSCLWIKTNDYAPKVKEKQVEQSEKPFVY